MGRRQENKKQKKEHVRSASFSTRRDEVRLRNTLTSPFRVLRLYANSWAVLTQHPGSQFLNGNSASVYTIGPGSGNRIKTGFAEQSFFFLPSIYSVVS